MTDQRFTELLGKQLAGEISQDESVELTSILSANPERSAEYNLLQNYFESKPIDDENIDVVFDRIKAKIKFSKNTILNPSKNKNYKIWLRIAAVVAVVLAGGLLFYKTDIFSKKQVNSPLLVVLVKAKEVKIIVLADGSSVKINSGSNLKYPVVFSGENRNVYLTGEAFFTVKKDAKHPFIVHTNQLAVKVLGTEFNVKAYANDNFTETTLIKGSVAIYLKNNPAKTYILKPDDKFTFSNGRPQLGVLSQLSKEKEGQIMETAWTNHELVFKNNRFDEVAKLFERWYDIKIIIDDPKLKATKFTGNFNKETITEALDALRIIENFDYSKRGRNVYIYR